MKITKIYLGGLDPPYTLKTLQDCMCGVQRISTILYNNPSATLESVNASRLEIQTTEPVHLNSLDTWMSAPSKNSMKL